MRRKEKNQPRNRKPLRCAAGRSLAMRGGAKPRVALILNKRAHRSPDSLGATVGVPSSLLSLNREGPVSTVVFLCLDPYARTLCARQTRLRFSGASTH